MENGRNSITAKGLEISYDIIGEAGIRTQGTVSRSHAFQACSFDQLGHLSSQKIIRHRQPEKHKFSQIPNKIKEIINL